jgi:hypothetical protein
VFAALTDAVSRTAVVVAKTVLARFAGTPATAGVVHAAVTGHDQRDIELLHR